ncbi:MAG: hypothetical protein JO166_00605 [Deltaproteobacteria bacterium]|nr:hypothetical protein [Deltaproteobacteria bacterium]
MSSHGISLIEAMVADGVVSGPVQIITDGQIHRLHGPDDKPGRKNSYYRCFSEHAAHFGNWKTGVSQLWFNNLRQVNSTERQKIRDQIKAAKAESDKAQVDRYAKAAKRAEKIWTKAQPIADPSAHDYLVAKSIQPHRARKFGRAIVIPVLDPDSGYPTSLQFIYPDGAKKFLSGGRIKGGYFPMADEPIKGHPLVLAIAEGFATASTVHELARYNDELVPVAVAFNAGNLLAVAKAMRKKHPRTGILICGDDDRKPVATLAPRWPRRRPRPVVAFQYCRNFQKALLTIKAILMICWK